MGFPRQKYWSGLPFPSPGDLPDPGIEPASPALEVDSLLLSLQIPKCHLNYRSQSFYEAERPVTACGIPSVCSPCNSIYVVYCCTFEEQKLPFPSGLRADIKD